MGRAPCCDKANVKRGPWSLEEDDKLKSYIDKHGTGGNWISLPQKIGLKRCGKSCRLRWLNYLRPNIKHGGFTEDEDNLICNLYITIGSRWSIIAGQLPGRTDNDIKNYWNTRLKKKLLGKQKREQQNRGNKQQLETTTKNFHQNYYSLNNNNNESLSIYTTWPPNQVSPPLSLTDSLIMSPFVTNLTYSDQTQPKDESFEYIPNHTVNQEVFKNLNFDVINGGFEASDVTFQGLVNDEIPEETVYYSMPQPCVDGVDLVNYSSTTTSSMISPESVILGDQMSNFLVYPYGYEAFQPIMGQDWNYLDVTGLPGY